MAKILVVEDNHDYQELLQNFLENANYEVTAASDGVRAAECAAAQSFDLILLDLMLTALDSESCQMRGYGLCIDDYITKPVSMALLLQKVEAVLRRTMPSTLRHAQNAPGVLHFEDLSLDPETHTVSVCDAPVDFTLREFEILQELMRSPGAVVTRKTLVEKLWGYDFSTGDTRIVDTHMKNIRRKLGAADCIETVRGVGYRLKRRPDGQTDA